MHVSSCDIALLMTTMEHYPNIIENYIYIIIFISSIQGGQRVPLVGKPY